MAVKSFGSITIFPAFSTIVVFVVFIIAGLSILPIIPVQLNPNTRLPAITVQFGVRNLPAMEIEEKLTSVMEGAFSTIEGVNSIHSQSNEGSGTVTLQFDKYVDTGIKRHEVVSIIRQIYPSFPVHTPFPNIAIRGAGEGQNNNPVMMYTVISDYKISDVESVLNQFVIGQLSGIKNVSEITVYGGAPEIYEIVYDNGLMMQSGVSLYNLVRAITNLNRRTFIGSIIDLKNHRQQKSIIVENRMGDHLKLEDVVVLNSNRHKLIRIKDFAKVLKKEEPSGFYYRVNGRNTVNIGIVPKEGANLLELAGHVSTEIKKIKQNLPGGYQLFLVMNHTEFIKKEVDKLVWYSLMSVIILLIFILLMSRDFRYVLVIFISLLASVSVSFFFYFLFGIQLHLFSFAGITVSFGMMIDYTIIMIEHLKRNRNMHVFLAVLASAGTSVNSLSAIYFLGDEVQIRLSDFVSVIIINISVSLATSLLLVPALFEKLKPRSRFNMMLPVKRLRFFYHTMHIHQYIIYFVHRRKIAFFCIVALSFGFPLFLLPPVIENDNAWANFYNSTIGSETYQTVLKEPVEKWLGGALRIFVQKVEHGEYSDNREETRINITANLPKGSTLEQTNELFVRLENYLAGVKEISFFETIIQSPLDARISVFFKKEFIHSEIPSMLANVLSRKVLELGSADWNVSGAGTGFNSNFGERSGSYHFYIYGFSYNELQKYAQQVKHIIEQNPRVEDVTISGSEEMFRINNYEYVMGVDREKAADNNISISGFVPGLKTLAKHNDRITTITQHGVNMDVFMTSVESKLLDMWGIKNNSISFNKNIRKFTTVGNIEKRQTAESINKSNQQYQLVIDFNYIGENEEAASYVNKISKELTRKMPLGFSVENEPRPSQGNKENSSNTVSQNWLIFYILVAIYFVCAILFNSLLQPLAVIAMIPFSFIGVFLSFYLFGIKFDQGGYASLVLLSGLTVNSVIYFMNERNVIICHHTNKRLGYNDFFFKAFSQKITPVLLTLTSSSLGLTPFLLTGSKEPFWFPLAVGTISGLLFSIIALFFLLPLFFLKREFHYNKLQPINN
jgi:multidrug efflux pump subunit AcrB